MECVMRVPPACTETPTYANYKAVPKCIILQVNAYYIFTNIQRSYRLNVVGVHCYSTV